MQHPNWWRLLAGALVWVAAGAADAQPLLVSLDDLAALRAAADAGVSPQQETRDRLLQDARDPWAWGSVSGAYVTSGSSGAKRCHPESDPDSSFLTEGAPDAYAQALGAHLSGDEGLAEEARSHLLDLVDTYGFTGLEGPFGGHNQCILDLAFSIPIWIETARLLEATAVWTASDGERLRSWLSSEVYPRVAWASRVRSNNWGTAGSLAAWSIASWVGGGVERLTEISPEVRSDSPAEAAASHAEVQLARMRGQLDGDARCDELGVQEHGGIPEALRRGDTGCSGDFVRSDDASLRYQALHVELLVLHAELMRREGDLTLYEASVVPDTPAILQSILFVIDNPTPGGLSWAWPESRAGMLTVAATYYDHPSLAAAADADSSFRGGRILPYASVTHGPGTDPAATDPPDPGIGPPGPPRLALAD